MFFQLRFLAVGFILYFPSDDPYWTWSPSHGHMLLITVIFIWIAVGVCIFLFLQSSIVCYILKQRYSDNENDIYNEQIVSNNSVHINDSEDDENDS